MKISFRRGLEARITSFACILLIAGVVQAQEAITIGGASCTIKNFGSNTARKGVRYFDGEILNILDATRLSVVCPVATYTFESFTDIGLRLGNYSDVSQSFRCTLSEWNLSAGEVASYTRNLTVPARTTDGISWQEVQRSELANKFVVECGVPPSSAIISILVAGYGGS